MFHSSNSKVHMYFISSPLIFSPLKNCVRLQKTTVFWFPNVFRVGHCLLVCAARTLNLSKPGRMAEKNQQHRSESQHCRFLPTTSRNSNVWVACRRADCFLFEKSFNFLLYAIASESLFGYELNRHSLRSCFIMDLCM